MPNTIDQLREAIAGAESVVVAGHKGPDGDCIGAALAFKSALEAIGKDVTVLSNDPVPKLVHFLKGASSVKVLRDDQDALAEGDIKHDLALLVDVGFTERAGRAAPALENATTLAVIDHHEIGPKQSGDIRIIDPGASATCYMLYTLMEQVGLQIDAAVADCLLTGIITDTGCFRFGNTNPQTLEAAAKLIGHGANISKINAFVWNNRPIEQIDMLKRAFNHMDLSKGERLAITYLSREDYAATGAEDEDTEGIASEIARIGSVEIAAVFREAKPGHVRVSVRSRGAIDVAEVCRKFGGGGHKNAAGCTIDGNVFDAMDAMRPDLEACLE